MRIFDNISRVQFHKIYACKNLYQIQTKTFIYQGASLLRMVEGFMGDDLIKGVRSYLREYKYSNAATDDLWKHLSNVSILSFVVLAVCWKVDNGRPNKNSKVMTWDTWEWVKIHSVRNISYLIWSLFLALWHHVVKCSKLVRTFQQIRAPPLPTPVYIMKIFLGFKRRSGHKGDYGHLDETEQLSHHHSNS